MSLNYFDKAAYSYDQYAFIQQQCADYLGKKVLNISKKGQDILDFGCGTGYLLKQLSEKLNVSGLEYSDSFSKISQQHLGKSSRIYTKIEDINCPFDIIVSNLTFHWIPFFDDLPKMLSKLLKKNGTLIFSTALPSSFSHFKTALTETALQCPMVINSFPRLTEIYQSFTNFFHVKHLNVSQHHIKFSNSVEILKHFKHTGTQGQANTQIWTKKKLTKIDKAFEKLAEVPILDYHIGSWHLKNKVSS